MYTILVFRIRIWDLCRLKRMVEIPRSSRAKLYYCIWIRVNTGEALPSRIQRKELRNGTWSNTCFLFLSLVPISRRRRSLRRSLQAAARRILAAMSRNEIALYPRRFPPLARDGTKTITVFPVFLKIVPGSTQLSSGYASPPWNRIAIGLTRRMLRLFPARKVVILPFFFLVAFRLLWFF